MKTINIYKSEGIGNIDTESIDIKIDQKIPMPDCVGSYKKADILFPNRPKYSVRH